MLGKAMIGVLSGPFVAGLCVLAGLVIARVGVLDPVWRIVDSTVPDDPVDDGFKGVVLVSLITSTVFSATFGMFVLRRGAAGAGEAIRVARRRFR